MVIAVGVLLCGWLMPNRAWAWAPMCDDTASTAIAPMVAPPVESGEIHPCAPALERHDAGRPALHPARVDDGQSPTPPNEETTSHDSPRFPAHSAEVIQVPPGSGSLTWLTSPALDGGPSPGFTRAIERPPCAAFLRTL